MKNALRFLAIAIVFAFAVTLIMTHIPASPLLAQGAGPYSYRDSGNGIVIYQPLCFEASALSGQDVCMKRSTAGHVNFLTGTLAANKDVVGTCTAAAGTTCTVTFATAFTAAPACVVTDQTTQQATGIKALPSTTTLVITTASSSDVFSYMCFGS